MLPSKHPPFPPFNHIPPLSSHLSITTKWWWEKLKNKFLNKFLLVFQVRTLFVSGLPMDTKPRELYLLFRQCKVCIEIEIKEKKKKLNMKINEMKWKNSGICKLPIEIYDKIKSPCCCKWQWNKILIISMNFILYQSMKTFTDFLFFYYFFIIFFNSIEKCHFSNRLLSSSIENHHHHQGYESSLLKLNNPAKNGKQTSVSHKNPLLFFRFRLPNFILIFILAWLNFFWNFEI